MTNDQLLKLPGAVGTLLADQSLSTRQSAEKLAVIAALVFSEIALRLPEPQAPEQAKTSKKEKTP